MLTEDDEQWSTTPVASKVDKGVDSMLEMQEPMATLHMEMLERIDASETRLLTEFDRWASGKESKMPSQHDAIHTLEIEMDLLKDRLHKLENRVLGMNGSTNT
jgi:hypothetical protein